MSDKSLNDLFQASRSEAAPEFVSEQDAECLIASSMHSVPRTTLGQQLKEKLLSTPLKLGITAMTLAGIITIGILALQPKSTVSPSHITSNIQPQITSPTTVPEIQSTPHSAPLAAPMSHERAIAVNQPASVPTVPTPKAAPAAIADSLHAVELPPEKLAEFGITLQDDGEIDFIAPDHGLEFPVVGSMRLRLSEQKVERTSDSSMNILPGLTKSLFEPRLVTDQTGAKRFFSFEVDTTVSVGNKSVHMKAKASVVPIKEEAGVHRDLPSDSILARIDQQFEINSPEGSATQRKLRLQMKTDSKTDSSLRVAMQLIEQIGKNLNDGQITDADSVRSEQIMQIAANAFGINRDSLVQSIHSGNTPDFVINLNQKSRWKNHTNPENLIPIRIRNTKSAGHPNELIFWYEPSAEIAAMLPNAGVQPNMNKPQHFALSIFPNPTSGAATVHYTIDGGKQAEFGIYNLLGQKKIDCGTSSGTGDLKLDLSKLEAGVYLLVTTTKNGERSIERIVLNK